LLLIKYHHILSHHPNKERILCHFL